MLHPKTELRFINETVGYGVYATDRIPKGTITYVKDSLEVIISPSEYLNHLEPVREVIEKYSYIDEAGNRIVSWDFAKYINHCCNCNSISTGYGFEIAIRDIEKGEQITDEYGIFNLESPMNLVCSEKNCRKTIGPGDFDLHYEAWDTKILGAIPLLMKVDQPLLGFIEPKTRAELDEYLADPDAYKSVYALKCTLEGF